MFQVFLVAARIRGLASLVGLVALLVGLVFGLALDDVLPTAVELGLITGGFVLVVGGGLLSFVPGAPRIQPREVAPPVRGRWSALNSPASKVPSHGTHGHGQTFAVDLLFEPADGSRPKFGSGPAFRPPTDYPGFGQELYAPDDGTVVAVHDGARDHRSRTTWPAVAYLMLEGAFRELPGSRFVLGNHVILRLDDGVFALLAHLQRGSATVRRGQRVARGDVLGRCGNSGNTSEPHVHFQLMDLRWPFLAMGLPFTFTGIDELPKNEEILEVDG